MQLPQQSWNQLWLHTTQLFLPVLAVVSGNQLLACWTLWISRKWNAAWSATPVPLALATWTLQTPGSEPKKFKYLRLKMCHVASHGDGTSIEMQKSKEFTTRMLRVTRDVDSLEGKIGKMMCLWLTKAPLCQRKGARHSQTKVPKVGNGNKPWLPLTQWCSWAYHKMQLGCASHERDSFKINS